MTLLGLASMAACGALYAFSRRHPWILVPTNVALTLKWLGESLDGMLARDLADAFGALFLFGGLGLPG
jgi:hypothetical protein